MMLHLAKALLQLILFSGFIFMYAFPAVERFLKHETILVKSLKRTGGIPAPSITIVAYSPATRIGWKVKPNEAFRRRITSHCSNYSDFERCLYAETFKGSDFIKDTIIGYDKKMSLGATEEIWQSDLTLVHRGRSYTLDPQMGNLHLEMGPNPSSDQLFVLLDHAFTYIIQVHDKNFFIINENQWGIPLSTVRVNPNTSVDSFYEISVTEHVELNLPSDPCEEDANYEFRVCVKESLAKKIGCRPSWDRWSDQTRNICTTIEQHRFLSLRGRSSEK